MSTGGEERTSLVRVRNPWGDKNEWKGDWSDGDKKWEKVDNETKKEMGLHYMYDGEFWIEFFTDLTGLCDLLAVFFHRRPEIPGPGRCICFGDPLMRVVQYFQYFLSCLDGDHQPCDVQGEQCRISCVQSPEPLLY